MSPYRFDDAPPHFAVPAQVAHTRAQASHAAQVVRDRFDRIPDVAIILGTGLGALGRAIETQAVIDYAEIPGFPLSTVESHAGRLLCGTLGGKTVVAMQGRFHLYEGYSAQQVAFPVRVMRELGARTLVVSNACGTLHPLWNAGEIMLIADHINFLGTNPLIGANDDALGPRFPDMSAPYDEELRGMARDVAREQQIVLREGVYVAITGPALETPSTACCARSAPTSWACRRCPRGSPPCTAGCACSGSPS
jgi:purine-nucleoside phosphorylase